ncbi:MAG TPA: RNB domain-containing ribonuclease, partial [Pseudonocardiaceae bacterium]|nr:RNB domain-containing ribonuclease [Pseudonocardiaceae bacterium]
MASRAASGGEGFAAIRTEFGLPVRFPDPVLAEAEQAVAAWGRGGAGSGAREDATDLPLVTIDPPGSKDLDQAVLVQARPGGGFRVHYAIADLGSFVSPD